MLPHQGVAQACGCPPVTVRDTVWVTDNAGAGVGSQVWTCDHHYVLQGEVFVNPGDTLRIEPGTVVLGAGGEGRSENLLEIPFAFGSINTVSYSTMPGALIVSRGRSWTPKARQPAPFNFPSWAIPWTDLWGLMCVGCGAVWRCAAPPRPTP